MKHIVINIITIVILLGFYFLFVHKDIKEINRKLDVFAQILVQSKLVEQTSTGLQVNEPLFMKDFKSNDELNINGQVEI